jgi:hypothetical protein
MNLDFPLIRLFLYFTLGLFSIVLFCLCAARLHYTTHLPGGDPLNGGAAFYDPIVVELLFTTIMTVPWCIFIMHSIHKRAENRLVSTFRGELIGLSILWLFWLVGAAIASSMWGDLTFCQSFHACRLLSALVAFSWLGWIVITAILGVNILFSFANKALKEPLHGRWDPRTSHYYDNHA